MYNKFFFALFKIAFQNSFLKLSKFEIYKVPYDCSTLKGLSNNVLNVMISS